MTDPARRWVERVAKVTPEKQVDMLTMELEEQINSHEVQKMEQVAVKPLPTPAADDLPSEIQELEPAPEGPTSGTTAVEQKPTEVVEETPVMIKEQVQMLHTSTTSTGNFEKLPALVKEQLRYCATVLKGLKRHPQSAPFQVPVDPVALNIPDYFNVVKTPMDLSTISKKLEAGEYTDAEGFVADVKLMLNNCFAYNHVDSAVTKMGRSLEKYFNTAIGKMPTSLPTPGDEEKSRRKSESSTTTPLAAGRARRESHAPTRLANAQMMGSTTPRGRARSTANPEMAFCNSVLRELSKKAHLAITWPFQEPVDPVKLGIPDYFDVIKNPMDLSTIRRKLESGQYASTEMFEGDVRLIFSNCYSYNAPESDVVGLCRAFEKLFESKWAQKPGQFTYSTSSVDDMDSDSEKILEINRQIQALQQELNTLLMKRKHRSTSASSGITPRPKKASRPASKPTAVITEEDFLSRPMTFEEKRQLSIEVNNLSPEKLGRVVEIIQAGMALEAQGDSDVIELDIESLNVRTLRQLQKYVMECKGITSFAAMLGEAGTTVKRKKSTSTGGAPAAKKPNTGAAPPSANTAATAAAGAMSTDEESSDEDLD